MMDAIKYYPIKTDENMIDENGEPLQHADIREDCIVCHPEIKSSLEQAIEFFSNQENEEE